METDLHAADADADGTAASDASLTDAMQVMATWQDGARTLVGAETLTIIGKSRFPSPYSNAVWPLDHDVAPAPLLQAASQTFPDRRYFVWARGPLAAALDALAPERGFVSLGTLPAMVIEAPVELRDGSPVTVTQVTDAAVFEDFLHVSQVAFAEAGLPPSVAASLFADSGRALESADVFVGRVEGRAVAAALSITRSSAVARVGGLYWVGTLPDARRQGAGDAVTRAATNACFARGATIVTLQASAAGEPVYRRMGYRVVARYSRYLSPQRTA